MPSRDGSAEIPRGQTVDRRVPARRPASGGSTAPQRRPAGARRSGLCYRRGLHDQVSGAKPRRSACEVCCRLSAKVRQLRFRTRAGRTTDCRGCRSGREFAPRFGNRAKLGRRRLTDVLAAYALRSFELELPKHDAADLAGERLGQVGDELDAPRVGIG